MTMPKLTLFHFPGACSRVAVCALEMAELEYELKLVNIATGEQASAAYRSVSPLGKVPALLIDGDLLLENSAILTFIHGLRPEAGVFPTDDSPRARAEVVGGLSFCGGTLHPQIRGIVNPQRLTKGDGEPVRAQSRELAGKSFGYAESRLAERNWWLGEQSIVDVYLDWAFGVACRGGFEKGPYPNLAHLEERLTLIPAYARMQASEVRCREELGL